MAHKGAPPLPSVSTPRGGVVKMWPSELTGLRPPLLVAAAVVVVAVRVLLRLLLFFFLPSRGLPYG